MSNINTKHTDVPYNGANVPIILAAKVMKKDPMFVRIGLQRGLLPFGVAFKKDETGEQYDYYISPKLFCEFTGYQYIEDNGRNEL